MRPVLVTGPTGSGKELVARSIHLGGSAPGGPLVDVNCGSIPPNLVESQFFGHERGAFTGAERRQAGLFESVGDGTLFLDEIGELPLAIQPALLRVLETGRFRSVGGSDERRFAGRIVAATHRDLREHVERGLFRADLFFRLDVLTVTVPSLEERRHDIPELAAHFIAAQERSIHLTDDALRALMAAPWPGNVRQLRNLIDRIAVFSESERVTAQTLAALCPPAHRPLDDGELDRLARAIVALRPAGHEVDKLSMISRAVSAAALAVSDGNKSAAARLLGIDRKALDRRLRGN